MKRLAFCLFAVLLLVSVSEGQTEPAGALGYHRLMVSGRARLEEGMCQKAIECFQEALKLEPNDVEATFSMASAMMGQYRFEEALRLLLPIMEKHPDNATVKNNVAWCLLNSRDPKVRDLQRALALSRDAVFAVQNNYNLWHTLASIHFELKDYERAKKVAMIAIVTGRMVNRMIPRECLQLLKECKKALGETEDDGESVIVEKSSNE